MIIPINGTIVSNADKEIYDWFGIECVSPGMVGEMLKEADGEPVTVTVNSGGGNLFAGTEIYSMLRTYGGDVTIDVMSLAASAASVIAMAGKSRIAPPAMLMIHQVSTVASGNKDDLIQEAGVLDAADKAVAGAYVEKTGLDEETLLSLMGDETWLTAKDAVELGFIDEIIPRSETMVNSVARVLSASEIEDARKKMNHDKTQKALNDELSRTKRLRGLHD